MGSVMDGDAYLAIDLGAESGRAILGKLDRHRLSLEEIHRFPNGPVRVSEHLHWDVLQIWQQILNSLRKAGSICGDSLSSVGLDTWGVDFALLDKQDSLIENPYHYRDSRTNGMIEAGFNIVSPQEIYSQTGNQFIQFNSLFQLLSMKISRSPALDIAETFLNMPDLFNFWLTGRKASEFTIASTTQCFNPILRTWASELLERMGLPVKIFKEIISPASIYGKLLPNIASETGVRPFAVSAIGSHDTASAVVAVPAELDRYVFISSGTWSLVGSELPDPVINEMSLEFNFTNEGGVEGKYRFLKNVNALWFVQECRRFWASKGRDYTYDQLTEMASQAPEFAAMFNPLDPIFLSPGDIPSRIREYTRLHGQGAPDTVAGLVRCILESLALVYRQVIEKIEIILGYRLEAIHIIGGGSRNWLLNQFTSDATGLPVIAGPIEAAAIGNILVQALASGALDSLADARALVRNSFPLKIYEPGNSEPWDSAYETFNKFA
jgi:rhamnulokinase